MTNQPGIKNGHPVLVGGPQGMLHLGIYISDSDTEPSYYMRSKDYGATWGAKEVVTSAADQPFSMTVSAGYVHMAVIPANGGTPAYYTRRALGAP